MFVKITASIALCAGCSKKFGLHNYRQQTSDYTEESNTLNQRSSQDHVCTDVVCSFWLTSDRFQSALTDVTNTHTSRDSSDTGADCTTSFS